MTKPNPSRFTGPFTLEGPTVATVLARLGIDRVDRNEQQAAIREAAHAGRLYPLELAVLRDAHWL